MNAPADPPKKPRGFAALTPEQRSAISRAGGIAAHQQGTAHEFTKETAKTAGAKGGRAKGKARSSLKEEGEP